MNILSLYTSLPSSAALYSNGQITAATHEERFSRLKNDERFPEKSISFCLKELGLASSNLDAVAIASYIGASFDDTITRKSQWSTDDYLREQYEKWLPLSLGKKNNYRTSLEIFPEKIDFSIYPQNFLKDLINKSDRNQKFQQGIISLVSNYLNISKSKIVRIEHHRCHAAYSYYASSFRGEDILALTIDGSGDGLNATIGLFDKKGLYTRRFETNKCNIGRIYRYMTLLLGMKPNEHEYKLMGLAPYGKEKYAKKALEVFKSTLYVDGIDFKWGIEPTDSYFWFKERLEGIRFDSIAFALQTWVEDLLTTWVENAVKFFGVRKVVISGGVAMNIKAMGKIAALPVIDKIFIGGSASDESMAISAGICLAEDLTRKKYKSWNSKNVKSLTHLYLGPKAEKSQETFIIKKLKSTLFNIIESPTADYIATCLINGKILARCAGRMEFGQRALGNRSILADPRDLKVKEKINAAIKSRDFWMPFAPVILDTFVSRYLINPKCLESPHMTLGFETTSLGYEAMIAACHPADRTARAQILYREANPELYKIIERFSEKTGCGALLNTSFNLHGHPIVNTPEEALYVLTESGLDGLILNNYIIIKK